MLSDVCSSSHIQIVRPWSSFLTPGDSSITAYILRNLVPFSVIMRETEGPANVVDGPRIWDPATCRCDNWVWEVLTCAYREIFEKTLRRKHVRRPRAQ